MGRGVKVTPPHQFFLNNFFCKNRIDLQIHDFLSSVQFKKKYYRSVDNHPKLTEIGKNGKISGFWATKATFKHFCHFFATSLVSNIYVRNSFGEKKIRKITSDFFIAF